MPIISPLPLYSGPDAHVVVHRIGKLLGRDHSQAFKRVQLLLGNLAGRVFGGGALNGRALTLFVRRRGRLAVRR